MKKNMITVMIVLLGIMIISANPILAQCSKKCTKATCPNVTNCAVSGEKTAICACGMEFKVTDESSYVEHEGKRYYVCSAECAEKIKANADTMIPMLEKKVEEYKSKTKTSGNVIRTDEQGNQIAMCSCGAEIKAGEASAKREYNGETFYFCCDNCAAKFDENPEAACGGMLGKHHKSM